jgi:hypothetical protein
MNHISIEAKRKRSPGTDGVPCLDSHPESIAEQHQPLSIGE